MIYDTYLKRWELVFWSGICAAMMWLFTMLAIEAGTGMPARLAIQHYGFWKALFFSGKPY